MDKEQEETIVKNFFNKRLQERVIFELTSAKRRQNEECYAISWSKEIDGKHLPLLTALEAAVGMGMPSIISCIPGKLAYFESEQEYGAPPRYILKKN